MSKSLTEMFDMIEKGWGDLVKGEEVQNLLKAWFKEFSEVQNRPIIWLPVESETNTRAIIVSSDGRSLLRKTTRARGILGSIKEYYFHTPEETIRILEDADKRISKEIRNLTECRENCRKTLQEITEGGLK